MSSRAEKAAAMRAKILARSKDRMATVSGLPAPATATTNDDENASADAAAASSSSVSAAAAPSSSSSLSAEDAAAALDAALDEMGSTPVAAAAAPAAASSEASAAVDAASAIPVAADPHEFPSASEVRDTQARDADADFNAFVQAQQQQMMMQQAGPASSEPSAAVRAAARRKAKDAAAASSLDMPLPPAHSPLVLWRARVSAQLRSTPPLRMATVLGVVLAGALAGLGYIEGGFGWLILVQIVAQSTAFVLGQVAQQKQTNKSEAAASASAAAARRPAPSPPPMDTPSPAPSAADDDANIIELDTDAYRIATGQTAASAGRGAAAAAAAFPGFPPGFAGLCGAGGTGSAADLNLSALGLPPVVDTLLSGATLFFKYAALVRQVLNDAMIFLFVLVIANALVQLSYAEAVVYTTQ